MQISAGERADELTTKEVKRLIDILKDKGLTDEQIYEVIRYIADGE